MWKKIDKYNDKEAPQIWGGKFANILPGGDVCQLWAKIQPKAGKRPLVTKIQEFASKIHKNNYVCQLLCLQNVGKRPFLETYFVDFFFRTSVLASLDLSRQLLS